MAKPSGISSVLQVRTMEKRIVRSKDYAWVGYRCDKCRNQFEGIVKIGCGTVRLTCSVCGHAVVIYV
jgi:hypothetical protein